MMDHSFTSLKAAWQFYMAMSKRGVACTLKTINEYDHVVTVLD
jgi:hypothetical protein